MKTLPMSNELKAVRRLLKKTNGKMFLDVGEPDNERIQQSIDAVWDYRSSEAEVVREVYNDCLDRHCEVMKRAMEEEARGLKL